MTRTRRTQSVGAFQLAELLGRGTSGEVWSARHPASHTLVAVKALTGEEARTEKFRAAFDREVRAVAALDHPGIVRVFDFGRLTQPIQTLHSTWVAGTPWLAVEKLDQQGLRLPDGAGWGWLRRVLQEILNALAHAHARQLIHRDLKPANILLRGAHVCIVDFGLALRLAAEDQANTENPGIVGTPAYMAPEQINGDINAFGPWTDLYALGCIAYRLAAGQAPFSEPGADVSGILAGHLARPAPPLSPLFEVPPDFPDWCARLLEKQPRHRFQCAADAAWELKQIGQGWQTRDPTFVTTRTQKALKPELLKTGAPISSEQVESVVSAARTSDADATIRHALSDEDQAKLERQRNPAISEPARRPIVGSWRLNSLERNELPNAPPGVGLGLFEFRDVPLVARDQERDILWDALQQVSQESRPQTLLLRGPAGTGKSRLAQWLVRRAHELGAAEFVKATHSRLGGPADGLIPMMRRAVGGTGLNEQDLWYRLVHLLSIWSLPDDEDADALCAVLHAGDTPRNTFQSPREMHHLFLRVLAGRARARKPLIVWLDDLQWGLGSVGLLKLATTHSNAATGPVLFLATVREESLANQPLVQSRIDELQTHTRTLKVPGLSGGSIRTLLSKMVGLEGNVVSELITRSKGNPQFAVELVRSWISREWLLPSDAGFILSPDATVEIPSSTQQLWMSRLLDALQGAADDAWTALELAATLGQDVLDHEWSAACSQKDVDETRHRARELLLAHRLALPCPDGASRNNDWSFAHAMIREAVLQRARERGVTQNLNKCCAVVIAAGDSPHKAERLGMHLALAGEPDTALESLVEGAQRRIDAGDTDRAAVLLNQCRDLIADSALTEEDPRVVKVWIARSWQARLMEDHTASRKWGEKAVEAARTGSWPAILAHALLATGRAMRNAGDVERAEAMNREALENALQTSDLLLTARCRRGIGILCLVTGRLEEAAAHLKEASGEFEAAGSIGVVDRGICHLGLATMLMRRGDEDLAFEHYDQAMVCFQEQHCRYWIANCTNDKADLHRRTGNLQEAEKGYQDAIRMLQNLGVDPVIPRINLGALHVERDEFELGRTTLTPAVDALKKEQRLGLLAQIQVYLLPCHAGLADWASFDALLNDSLSLIQQTSTASVDVARWAERAGHLCLDAQMQERARTVLQLARDQWSALGRNDDEERVQSLIN